MLVLLALTNFATCLLGSAVAHHVAKFTQVFQQACGRYSPHSQHQALYEALVCGYRLPASKLKSDLVQTALLHLIVASGSHLALFEGTLRALLPQTKKTEAAIGLVLLTYALFAGLCPPFLRVLLFWGYTSLNNFYGLGWTRLQTLTIAGFSTLTLCNQPNDLLSLALSWIAGLAVHLTMGHGEGRKKRERGTSTSLMFHATLYALMIPAMLPLTVPHPLTIFWNLLLGPILTIVLFPVSLLAFVLPASLLPVADYPLDLCIQLVGYAARFTPSGLSRVNLPILWLWLYLFTLLLVAHLIESRKSACLNKIG